MGQAGTTQPLRRWSAGDAAARDELIAHVYAELRTLARHTLPDHEILAIDQALEHLESLDERNCRVVEMMFLAGDTQVEIAAIPGIARATVERNWSFAHSGLHVQIESPPASP